MPQLVDLRRVGSLLLATIHVASTPARTAERELAGVLGRLDAKLAHANLLVKFASLVGFVPHRVLPVVSLAPLWSKAGARPVTSARFLGAPLAMCADRGSRALVLRRMKARPLLSVIGVARDGI